MRLGVRNCGKFFSESFRKGLCWKNCYFITRFFVRRSDFSPWTHTWQLFYTIYVFRTCLAYYNPCSGFMSVTNHLSISFMGSTPNTRWFYIFVIRTVKSTVRRMNTPVLISFSTWVHTIFPVYGLYCYFWHDCTPVSDSTWCRNIRTLKNIAYPFKHGPWFVLPQYMIECR